MSNQDRYFNTILVFVGVANFFIAAKGFLFPTETGTYGDNI